MSESSEAAALFRDEPERVGAGYAHVAPEQGVDAGEGLTYAVPGALSDLAVGERVMVPLGKSNKPVPGFVLERSQTSELGPGRRGRIKAILSRDAYGLSLPRDLIELARWIAGYYCCPLGMVFGSMLPAAVRRGTGTVLTTLVGLSQVDGAEVKLTKLQHAIVEAMRGATDAGQPWLEIHELLRRADAKSAAAVNKLVDKGVVVKKQDRRVVSDLDVRAQREAEGADRIRLNQPQQQALDAITARLHSGFSVNLLHGVTGSGKTEVYLRLIEALVNQTHQAEAPPSSAPPGVVVLVPEIALTPQTVGRFFERFPDHLVAVLHSGLSAAQRHMHWRRILDGEARVVIGARSAVFAPLPNPSLMIVDEEHDSSYKQDQLPRYHARDVAIRRGQMLKVPVVLGSATPSLESYYNSGGGLIPSSEGGPAKHNRSSYHLLSLPTRVAGATFPGVHIVDMRDERRKRYQMTGKGGVHLLSLALEKQLQQTLEAGSQALLLLNRRGYANYIACPSQKCGWMMRCDHCDTTLVYHKNADLPTGGVVRCHHCHAEQLLPDQCPQCTRQITTFGLGTQRIEEELARKFPYARPARMDSDVMRSARDYQQTLDQFRDGQTNVLLGTQMIAKGLDFPGVQLVGIIHADTALHMPDFRATERTFQLIAQVAGRSGRRERPGLVVLQTFNPDAPAITLAANHDYPTFAQQELAVRAEVGLPPVGRMARIVIRDKDSLKCQEHAQVLASHLRQTNEQRNAGVRLRGPAWCPIGRIADYHRQQIELLAPTAGPLQRLITSLRNARQLISDSHTAVDVDPVSLL